MKVKQLIEQLSKMPWDADVKYLWDGYARSDVEHVWESNSEGVILCDSGEVVYGTECLPKGTEAPPRDHYWYSPEKNNETN